ncbi:ComF family protein [Streptosporangium sp. NPDC001559]|uniref:ComF family protein n=1 Tax=Streptosporangium sp. NPDC001559 TaxID=3366187 RepID=UPI0036E6120A
MIGVKAGVLEHGIEQMKKGIYGWGMIFARIVLGHLYTHPELVQPMHAIIPMPAYRQPNEPRKGKDHAGYVIERAIEEDDSGLPFILSPPLIEKVAKTKRMRETGSAAERRILAQTLFTSLHVPNPEKVRGINVLVYDDVFTGGNTLNAVARRLKSAGAQGVYGLTLARQQWRT